MEDPNDLTQSIPVGDDVLEADGPVAFNQSPNEHGEIVVDIVYHNRVVRGFNGWDESNPAGGFALNGDPQLGFVLALRADDVDMRGLANAANRRDLIRESIAHEAGHGFHINHYFVQARSMAPALAQLWVQEFAGPLVAFHGGPWAAPPINPDVMCSNAGMPVPTAFDETSIRQIRLHLKH